MASDDDDPRPTEQNDTNIDQLQPETTTEHTTLAERHQSALRHIHTLQGHNARLYEDNCRLVNAINTLNDRLAFLSVPQNAQVLRLADLHDKLRASESNRALINRKYQELLQCASASSAQHHIAEELQATRDAYASLGREFRLLADKHARLTAVADASRVAQQQSQAAVRGLVPAARPEFATAPPFRAHDQSRSSYPSPTSAISPPSFQPLDQKENHRRHSAESVIPQPTLRSAPTPVATTWIAPLPTPPPSAALSRDQMTPTGFPVHASVSAVSLPFPHQPQITHDPRTLSGPPAVTQSMHLVQRGVSAQLNTPIHLRQRGGETIDSSNDESLPCDKQVPDSPPLLSSPRAPKRPNSEPEISASPGELKKPRTKGEADHPLATTASVDIANKMLPPPAPTDPHDDPNLPVPDSSVRSYQDCVNLIFEKDADVENGVFCGLCLDRYEAEMITDPPDVLVQPDFDLLVRHCMTEHPTVWDDLRCGHDLKA